MDGPQIEVVKPPLLPRPDFSSIPSGHSGMATAPAQLRTHVIAAESPDEVARQPQV
jgi:hypothetical protein